MRSDRGPSIAPTVDGASGSGQPRWYLELSQCPALYSSVYLPTPSSLSVNLQTLVLQFLFANWPVLAAGRNMAFAAKSLAGRFLGHASRRSAAFLPISFLRLHSSDFNPNHSPSPVEVDVVGCGSTLTIDRSGLACNEGHSHVDSRKEAVSAMSNHLNALIRFRGGPITVAEYMEEVLTNPNAGFYMNRDVFGAGGDFVTSPDISQMFGELIGVWSTCLWQQIGRPSKVALVELGPGRGTLMADLLRGTSKFEEFSRAVSVHLVECSPALRSIQEQNLQCVPSEDRAGPKPSGISGAPVSWYLDLDEVPRGVPSIVIAHEFFDALPVHQFQCTPLGWCEKLVDVGLTPSEQFRFVLSPKPTPASALYLTKRLQWVAEEERSQLNHAEVCPRAMSLTETIARRIGHDGGGALIIDYGEDKIISDSLQVTNRDLHSTRSKYFPQPGLLYGMCVNKF